MRELKFRVWDEEERRMLYSKFSVELSEDGKFENMLAVTENDGKVRISEHFILEQFTGRKDRNGKGIYEGDIIEWYDASVKKGTDPTKRHICRWSDIRRGFDDCFSCGVIIGNIHENPELLKKE